MISIIYDTETRELLRSSTPSTTSGRLGVSAAGLLSKKPCAEASTRLFVQVTAVHRQGKQSHRRRYVRSIIAILPMAQREAPHPRLCAFFSVSFLEHRWSWAAVRRRRLASIYVRNTNVFFALFNMEKKGRKENRKGKKSNGYYFGGRGLVGPCVAAWNVRG